MQNSSANEEYTQEELEMIQQAEQRKQQFHQEIWQK